MYHSRISGVGYYVPERIVTNHDLAKIMDTSDEWIYSRSGIRQRHYSHVSTGEMAWLAAERALAAAGVDADDIDLVVLVSTTPEEICPNTASYIKVLSHFNVQYSVQYSVKYSVQCSDE